MANNVDPKALLDRLEKIQGELGDNKLSEFAKTAKELADEEDVLELDSDPAIAGWQPTSQPGGGTGGVAKIPTLPAKAVIDLSKPTVKLPGVPQFTIPEELRVKDGGGEIVSPSELTQGDWLTVARNTHILYAYTMGEVAEKADPPGARHAALDWMVPDSIDFCVPMHLEASVTSQVALTEESASFVRAGFDKQQASAGFPFAAASFEREHKERQAVASESKRLRMIGRWYYPRVKLILKECATASERFKTAVRSALDAHDQKGDLKPLLDVFEAFGTAIPNEVILGGEVVFVSTEDCTGSVSEKEAENVMSAAVSLKINQAQGSAGATFQNAKGEKVTAASALGSSSFKGRGGDSTKISNPEIWPGTVKPARAWAAIGHARLTSIVEWLPDDLRGRVMALWAKVPVPPAIWELQELAQNPNGRAERAQFVLGARIVLDQQDGACGALQLACGTSMTPQLGRGDAVGGRASFHRYRKNDIWIDTASVCLPVPAGHNYSAATPDTWAENGKAPARFAIAGTNLTFDKWHLVEPRPGFDKLRAFKAETDGFVFCSVEARDDRERGFVTCEVDKVLIAAASVHNYAHRDNRIRYASFCAPFAKGSVVEVRMTPTTGTPYFQVWRMPSTSQAWKFTKPEEFLELGSYRPMVADGFLNGVVTIPDDGPRGTLRLDCVKERPTGGGGLHSIPIASAAVHVYNYKDRWISHSSAMIPVRKDYLVWAGWQPTSGAPQAQVYFTKVVPVE